MNPLKELILELSYNCNLACIMCGFGGHPVRSDRFMSKETLTRALDAVHLPPETIRLNGRGESTIHPDFIQLLGYVATRFPQSRINLFSHLSTASEAVMSALLEHRVQLFISFDSPDPGRFVSIRVRSNFNRILANLDRLADSEPRPFLIFTLQEVNFDDVAPMARFAAERRMHLLVNTVRRDQGIEPFREMVQQRADYLRSAFEEAKAVFSGTGLRCILPDQVQGIHLGSSVAQTTYGSRNSCPAIESELCVLYDGTATPCNMFNPYVYGSLVHENLVSLRSGDKFRWFKENHKEHYYCSNCACLGETS